MNATALRQQDTERNQALVRLVIAPLVTCHILWGHAQESFDTQWSWWVVCWALAFCGVSLVLLLDIIRRPGIRTGRRLFTMLNDYLGITFTLVLGGEIMLPVYGVLLWITVGYGLRYGSRYLLLATALATLSLLVVLALSTYWQSQPYLGITVLFTTLMVPAYMQVLLRGSHRAAEAERAAILAKSSFLAQASHDLRQPIHSISLFTACLRDGRLDGEQLRLVGNIDKSLQSVSRLFRSILDMYSLDSGHVEPRLENVALHTLLQQLVQQNCEAARWANVEVRLHARPLCVLGDPALLTTMVQNLLSNALKYAPGRRVLIGCRRRGGAVSIEVYDQGRGIGEEHQDKVFEEFYRVRQTHDHDIEGVGLGLAIVRRLAVLMTLRVRMRSVEGRGTLVAIDGLQQLAAPPTVAPITPEPRTAPRLLEGLRVCLIEDDANVLRATAALLEKWGCQVSRFTSLPEERADYDLLISDFDLGSGVSGADCIRELRARCGREVPALVVTGHEVERVQQALEGAAIPVLAKPVHPAELRSLLVALKLDDQAQQALHEAGLDRLGRRSGASGDVQRAQ